MEKRSVFTLLISKAKNTLNLLNIQAKILILGNGGLKNTATYE